MSSPFKSTQIIPTIHQRSSVRTRYSNRTLSWLLHQCVSPQIYHPNVDLEGNVCLNILREDWKPVLNLNSVMVGLFYLFLEPNAEDPLNKGVSCHLLVLTTDSHHISEAAEDLRRNREKFTFNVKNSMRGGNVNGQSYDNVQVK